MLQKQYKERVKGQGDTLHIYDYQLLHITREKMQFLSNTEGLR